MTRKNKILLATAIVVAAALFYGGCEYGQRSILKNTGSDTTITKDSLVIRYVPVPYRITDTDTQWLTKTKTTHDTDNVFFMPEIFIEPTDTAGILADWNSMIFYRDEQKLPRGRIVIEDTVTRNRIISRKLFTFNTDTTIRITTVLRPPRRLVGYFTLSGMGRPKDPFGGAGAGFAVKLPNDMVYQAEWKVIKGSEPMFEGRVMFPIRLFPKR